MELILIPVQNNHLEYYNKKKKWKVDVQNIGRPDSFQPLNKPHPGGPGWGGEPTVNPSSP